MHIFRVSDGKEQLYTADTGINHGINGRKVISGILDFLREIWHFETTPYLIALCRNKTVFFVWLFKG